MCQLMLQSVDELEGILFAKAAPEQVDQEPEAEALGERAQLPHVWARLSQR